MFVWDTFYALSSTNMAPDSGVIINKGVVDIGGSWCLEINHDAWHQISQHHVRRLTSLKQQEADKDTVFNVFIQNLAVWKSGGKLQNDDRTPLVNLWTCEPFLKLVFNTQLDLTSLYNYPQNIISNIQLSTPFVHLPLFFTPSMKFLPHNVTVLARKLPAFTFFVHIFLILFTVLSLHSIKQYIMHMCLAPAYKAVAS